MRRISLVLAVFVALGALLSACGGDDSTAGTTDSITKAEFVKEGSAICAKVNEQIEEEFSAFVKENDLKSEPDKADSEFVTEGIGKIAVQAMKRQLQELQELPMPSGDEDEIELILERQEESIEKVEEDPTFRTSGNPFEELNAPASKYGLVECSV